MSKNDKKMGMFQCTALVSGNIIGSGVFMLPALLAVYGSVSILGWAITSLGSVFLALVFAKLSAIIHQENGGPHSFVKKAFGKQAGFWVAWGYWILTWSSNTALLVAAISYLSKVYGPMPLPVMLFIEVFIWVVITLINLKGIKTAAKFELVITVLKLIPIIIIPIVAVFYVDMANLTPFIAKGGDFGFALKASVFLSLWGFIGIESATVPSKEVANPNKTIGIATIFGTSLAALVYILGSFAAIGVLGSGVAHSVAPYADLAGEIFGGHWGVVIAVCAAISCVGAFHGWSLVVARIAQGAADQGLFPKVFSQVNSEGTPVNSIIISSICTLVAIGFTLQADMLAQFSAIVDAAVTLILMIYLASVLAYFKLIKPKSFAVRLIGLGAVCFVIFGLYASGVKAVLFAFLLLLTGVPLQFGFAKSLFVKAKSFLHIV